MRYLLIFCLFLPLTVEGQYPPPTQYVWAESGLTLRAEAHSGGKKLGVIPFGDSVTVHNSYGENVALELLPAVPLPEEDRQGDSTLSYTVNSHYVEVEYEGQTGFVYAGYLCRYPTTIDEANNDGILLRWLSGTTNTADTLIFGHPAYGGPPRMIHFDKDICYRVLDVDGGSGEAVVLPAGTLQEGYLIANYLFGLEKNTRWQELPVGEAEEGEFLREVTETRLVFSSYNGETRIEVVAGLLIISWEWSC